MDILLKAAVHMGRPLQFAVLKLSTPRNIHSIGTHLNLQRGLNTRNVCGTNARSAIDYVLIPELAIGVRKAAA